MSQIDVARTFGEGFARQLAPWNEAVGKGPLPRALECTSSSSISERREACRSAASGRPYTGSG
jgi:hypothetical protein